jgi:hypothetical protein
MSRCPEPYDTGSHTNTYTHYTSRISTLILSYHLRQRLKMVVFLQVFVTKFVCVFLPSLAYRMSAHLTLLHLIFLIIQYLARRKNHVVPQCADFSALPLQPSRYSD